jgi:hypothetical protein
MDAVRRLLIPFAARNTTVGVVAAVAPVIADVARDVVITSARRRL